MEDTVAKRTGIILAYDKSEFRSRDQELLHSLAPHIDVVKVGLEAMTIFDSDSNKDIIGDHNANYSVAGLVAACTSDELEKGVMWDAKLHDIETTVSKTLKNIIEDRGKIAMITLHATMSSGALRAASKICAEANILPLGVTVLTDISPEECFRIYQRTPEQQVLELVTKTAEAGFGGNVCSSQEVKLLRDELGEHLKLVVPGTRPKWAAANDQKRVMTPGEAAQAGADYVVIGRPILKPPQGMSSLEAVKRIREELDKSHS